MSDYLGPAPAESAMTTTEVHAVQSGNVLHMGAHADCAICRPHPSAVTLRVPDSPAASPGEETEMSCCANCGQPTLVPHRVGAPWGGDVSYAGVEYVSRDCSDGWHRDCQSGGCECRCHRPSPAVLGLRKIEPEREQQ